MIQLYFLSIVCNGLSGYILLTGDEEVSFEKNSGFSFSNPVFHLALGIVSGVTGILKLLSPTMDGIPILGDLLPVAAGITSGLLLTFGIYRQETSSTAVPETSGTLDRLGASLMRFRKSVGLGLVATALLHFLFPQALFL
jgi:hypothetical protein